jgi:hypothetical protein
LPRPSGVKGPQLVNQSGVVKAEQPLPSRRAKELTSGAGRLGWTRLIGSAGVADHLPEAGQEPFELDAERPLEG